MTNIDELKDYIIELSKFDVDFLTHEIEKYGKDKVYNGFLRDCDCSRVSAEGFRWQQTIDFKYKQSISQVLYIIENYFQEEKDTKIQEIIDLHKRNLDYEILNPPIIYKKTKTQQNNKKKKPKQTEIEFASVKPLSAAKQKLAIKASKINLLKFNVNIAK